MAVFVPLIAVLMAFPGCFGRFPNTRASQTESSQGPVESLPDSSMLQNAISGPSTIPEMFVNMYHSESTEKDSEAEQVPVTLGPFSINLKPIREYMPLTIMEFDSHELTIPMGKKERFDASYTPFSILYPEPKLYKSGELPTIEEVVNNPRLIKGFEQTHAHPANRAVAIKLIDMVKNALTVVRFLPKLRALHAGEPGIPLEISELPITISGYPYGDSTFVLPACNFMMPYPGAA